MRVERERFWIRQTALTLISGSQLVVDQLYKKPPITEAVIEVRFAEPMELTQREKFIASFAPFYPHQQMIRNLALSVQVPPGTDEQPVEQMAQINPQLGHRRSSTDLTEILLLWPTNFIVSQLAPYPGWESFFARFARDWKTWKKVAGYRSITRIGVRFINRIDIPITEGIVEEAEYMNVFPRLPDSFGPLAGYGVQARTPIRDIECNLTVNSAAVPSPLIGHGSFVLDIDIAREANVPQSDHEITNLLGRVRIKKNEIFEACVTDKARELFQK